MNMTYGTSAETGRQVTLNRKDLKNPHMMIVGNIGSGRISILKSEIAQVASLTDDDLLIVGGGEHDSRRNYKNIKKAVLGDDTFINPLDVVFRKDSDEYEISNIANTMTSIAGFLMRRPLDANEIYLIAASVRTIFDDFIKDLKEKNKISDFEHNPTVKDVLELMEYAFGRNDNGEIVETKKINNIVVYERSIPFDCKTFVHDLKESAEPYMQLLSAKTNVSYEERMHLSIEKKAVTVRFIQKLAILNFTMNKLTLNSYKQKYTWVYFDDATEFLKKYVIDSFNDLFKRARSYYGILTTGIHGFSYNRGYDYAKLMNNTGLFQILRTAGEDLHILTASLGLPSSYIYEISHLSSGEALLTAYYHSVQKIRYDIKKEEELIR